MIKNYIKIAWRNLIKNKVSSIINIGGLAAGMTVAILNGLWINDELTFNTYHQNYDRIAEVNYSATEHGKRYVQTRQPNMLADVLKTTYGHNFSKVLMATGTDEYILSDGSKSISNNGRFIEAGGPELLSLKMIKGNWSGLNDQQSVFLSLSTAKALFGAGDPMNKLVKINTDMDVKVSGIYEDLPLNSQFHDVRFFAPFELYAANNPEIKEKNWENHSVYIYVQTKEGLSVDQVSSNIKDALLTSINHLEGMKEKAAQNPQVFLHPMKDWHLYSDFKEGDYDKGTINFIWMIGLIGMFVLVLACINFMNLSTARSEKRAKEVGIRKAMGSMRGQLIRQFLSESFLVAFMAFTASLLLALFTLPLLNQIAVKEITMPWGNMYFWLISLGFIILTGLLAGSYPAFFLSSFKSVKVLKGTFRSGEMSSSLRQALVVIQFTVSIVLIISTIIIFNQLKFAKDRPVGYSRNGLLMIQKKTDDFKGKFDLLRNELKNTGVVEEVAESNSSATNTEMANGGFSWKNKDEAMSDNFITSSVTREYGATVGWQFLHGRDFSSDFSSDSTAFVVNEAAVKYMGLKNPVGEVVEWDPKWRKAQKFKIIGVVKDMVVESPFEKTKPAVFFLFDYHKWINIRLNPNVSISEALPKIEGVFKKVTTNAPFEYKFADQEYALKFAAEERIGKLAAFFTILAILISCLGLFGLTAYAAEQRTKEIGIRKVLGAGIGSVVAMLSKDFLKLVLIAFIIAVPVAQWAMHKWLQNFAYRVDISLWIFILTGAAVTFIAFATVSFQAVKAAIVSPVESLRAE